MTIWQVAAGDGNRDYSEVFLRFGMLLMGPGDPGSFHDPTTDYERSDPDVRAMAVDMAAGDIVALKRPHGKRWQVLAVGRVTGDYQWLESFEHVEGWDLQHARSVQWHVPSEEVLVEGLTRGTLLRVINPAAQATIQHVWETATERTVLSLPPLPAVLKDEDLITALLDDGLQVASAETVAAALRRIRRLAGWYQRRGEDNSEHETRTFLVVPLLLALGWSEQRIKVEWRNMDIALFDQPYKRGGQLSTIVETKRLGEGLGHAEQQAMDYAKQHPMCASLLITDGIGYKLLRKDGDTWKHAGTLNLRRPRRSHPYLEGVGGAETVLRALLPGCGLRAL